jgi:hypothetical protein
LEIVMRQGLFALTLIAAYATSSRANAQPPAPDPQTQYNAAQTQVATYYANLGTLSTQITAALNKTPPDLATAGSRWESSTTSATYFTTLINFGDELVFRHS